MALEGASFLGLRPNVARLRIICFRPRPAGDLSWYVTGMPSSTRKTSTTVVKEVRNMRTALADRRCDHLLMVKSAETLVRSSEALQTGVAHLSPALADEIQERVCAAIASLATLELHGEAAGIEGITDPIGRMICERQLPNIYLCHLLAATLMGAEAGLRSLLLGTAVTVVEQPSASKRSRPTRRSPADAPQQARAVTPLASATKAPVSDTAADLLDRLSPAPAIVSAPSSGRVEIKRDTERI